jgi:hypothetical protein
MAIGNASSQKTPDQVEFEIELLRRHVVENRWIPITPTIPQMEFLASLEQEVLYGGAAGGGKSVALLAAALMFVDTPGYSALLLRRTFADLVLPKSLIPLSHEWLAGTPARWNSQDHQWNFPSGATLTFGYLDTDLDKYRYQSAAFSFCGFDELSQFMESMYLYLFSRLRRLKDHNVPIRMRSASNPGGVGHEFVRKRFIAPHDDHDRLFIPARLGDNPYLDKASYESALNRLDPIQRARLLYGDWNVVDAKGVFNAENLEKMRANLRPGVTGSFVLVE